MKDKYNNFIISFDDDQVLDNWYENINKSFPDVDKKIFNNICKFILRVDKSIIGRFAGDIRDLIALASSRYVTSKKMLNSDASNLAHVEIGTLFGASAILTDYAIKANSASNKFQNIMIDPLDGYYGNSNDLVSGLEVNAKTLFKNLKMFNVEGYKLIQKYSTDNQTINKIKEFSIVSLFIDGDHSFSGLLKDWNNFNKEVINGGHVIIDNVNDKNWPNINLFIDELKSKIGSQWEIIYEGSVTIVLEKKCDDILLIDTKFDLNTIHNIEKQVDQKFYRLINNKNRSINTRDQDIKKRDRQILSLDKQHSKALEKINTRDQDIKKRDGQINILEIQSKKNRIIVQKLTNLLKLSNKPLSLFNLKLKRTINIFLAGLK